MCGLGPVYSVEGAIHRLYVSRAMWGTRRQGDGGVPSNLNLNYIYVNINDVIIAARTSEVASPGIDVAGMIERHSTR